MANQPYTPASSLLSGGTRIGQAAWVKAIAAHNAKEATAIVASYFMLGGKCGINIDLALAQAVVETGFFTSPRWRDQRNPAGLGITSDDVPGVVFPSIEAGITAQYAHLAAYAYTPNTCPIHALGWVDIRPHFHDGQPRLSHLQEPPPGRQWATGPNYVGKILAIANALLLTQEDTSMDPTITKKLTPVNHWAGRNGNPVEAVVIHVSEGGKAGVESWFKNPASEASAHYLVNKDGTIWQFVREEDTAWANGVVKSPNLGDPLIAGWVHAGTNPNHRTIAIETEREWQERLTPPQLAALAWLCADLHRRYTLPTDGSRLLGHNEIDSVDRARCPSLSAGEWSALVKAIGGAAPVPVPPTPEPMLNPVVTEREVWGGEGKLIRETLVVKNTRTGKYFEQVKEYEAAGPALKGWHEV